MQFNVVNNKEMPVILCICVHDGMVCLAVSGLMQMCTGSRRSCSLSVAAIWNHVGKSTVQPFVFSLSSCFSALLLFLFFCFPPTNLPFFSLFPLLSQCDGCVDVPVWGLMTGLRGLLAMGVFYCLGAG